MKVTSLRQPAVVHDVDAISAGADRSLQLGAQARCRGGCLRRAAAGALRNAEADRDRCIDGRARRVDRADVRDADGARIGRRKRVEERRPRRERAL